MSANSFDRRNKPRIVTSFSLAAEDRWILEGIDRLARLEKRRRGRNYVIKRALTEYLTKHNPGNPQRPLFFSQPSSDQAREEAGIRFLKTRNRLSMRRISKIVGWSRSAVGRLTKDVEARPIVLGKSNSFPLNLWQQRWKLFMSGVPAEEAFRF